MKLDGIKNKLKKIGILGTVAILLAGCANDFDPAENEPVVIYGPPEMLMSPAPTDESVVDDSELPEAYEAPSVSEDEE